MRRRRRGCRDRFWQLAERAIRDKWATPDQVNKMWDTKRARRVSWCVRLGMLRDLLEQRAQLQQS